MRAALAIALIFVARFAAAAWFDPVRNADIAWQQWLGLQIMHSGHLPSALGAEAFTAAGAPWVPQEWALSLALAVTLHTPFFALLVLATALAGTAVLLFTALTARFYNASTLAVLIVVTCAGEAMLESYGIRAQVFAWAALAAFLYVIRCLPQRRQWWAIPIVVLWANVHASALLAPALLGLWTLGVVASSRELNARLRHSILLTLAACAAVFATPLGYRLPLYAVQLMQSPIRHSIKEWQRTTFDAPSFTFGALPVVLLALWFLASSKKRNWSEIFICSFVAILSILALRNIPIAAIVAAPLAARALTRYLPQSLRINRLFSERTAGALFLGGMALASAVVTFATIASPEYRKSALPSQAMAVLASQPGDHNLYCEDFAWCSLALAHPNVHEFLDGRCDPFPLDVWRDYNAVFFARGNWKSVLDRRGVDAMLFTNKGGLARAAASLKQWRVLYADASYSLLVRDRVRHAAYQQ